MQKTEPAVNDKFMAGSVLEEFENLLKLCGTDWRLAKH
jgi:hypothetical protein